MVLGPRAIAFPELIDKRFHKRRRTYGIQHPLDRLDARSYLWSVLIIPLVDAPVDLTRENHPRGLAGKLHRTEE
jgi:hypothetical protein